MTTNPQEQPPQPVPPPAPAEVPVPFEPLPPPLPPLAAPPAPRPWGFWSTLAWTALILVVYFLAAAVYVVVPAIQRILANPLADQQRIIQEATINHLAGASVFSAIVGMFFVWLFVRIRKMPIADYLALRRSVLWKSILCYLALAAVYGLMILIAGLAGIKDIGGANQTAIMQAIHPKAMLFVMLVVCAPLFEELLFRGFLFRGIQSRLGPWAAVFITAATFAAIHLQYNIFGMLLILCMGIVFGLTRWITGSVYITMLQHASVNALAFLGIIYKFHQ